jgi:acyl-coenzyme A thioesterase PaaI-like protein
MNQTYLRPTTEGDVVTVEGCCSRSGGRLAFADVEVWRPAAGADEAAAARADGQVMVALGRHTKYILKQPLPSSRL